MFITPHKCSLNSASVFSIFKIIVYNIYSFILLFIKSIGIINTFAFIVSFSIIFIVTKEYITIFIAILFMVITNFVKNIVIYINNNKEKQEKENSIKLNNKIFNKNYFSKINK